LDAAVLRYEFFDNMSAFKMVGTVMMNPVVRQIKPFLALLLHDVEMVLPFPICIGTSFCQFLVKNLVMCCTLLIHIPSFPISLSFDF